MSDIINVEEVLRKYSPLPLKNSPAWITMKTAIKEIVEAVVDKAAEKATVKCLNVENDYTGKHTQCSECEYHIRDKESILNVKKLIKYE